MRPRVLDSNAGRHGMARHRPGILKSYLKYLLFLFNQKQDSEICSFEIK